MNVYVKTLKASRKGVTRVDPSPLIEYVHRKACLQIMKIVSRPTEC